MFTTVEPESADLDRVLNFTSAALGVDEEQATNVVDGFLGAVEALMDEHRMLIAEQLFTEADRYTKGAFADGIRHAAAVVLDPPAPQIVAEPVRSATLETAAAAPGVVA